MLVLDDYADGRIFAGEDRFDFLAGIPTRYKEKIKAIFDKLPTEVEQSLAFEEDDDDFYIFYVEREDLFKYMEDRNASNFITGV